LAAARPLREAAFGRPGGGFYLNVLGRCAAFALDVVRVCASFDR
jgi:hypothetical protein